MQVSSSSSFVAPKSVSNFKMPTSPTRNKFKSKVKEISTEQEQVIKRKFDEQKNTPVIMPMTPTKKAKFVQYNNGSDEAPQFMPKLLFDISNNVSKPPMTPMKKSKSPLQNDYALLLQNAKKGTSPMGEVTYFAEGSYCNVYNLVADNQRVVKIFNERMTSTKSACMLKNFMESSVQNYRDAVRIGIPVAIIFNINKAVTDKYYDQEKIQGKFDITNQSHISQLKTMYLKSLEHNVILDLHPGNVLVKDKVVTLIDFIEDDEDGQTIFIRHGLEHLCKKGRDGQGWNKEKTTKFLAEFTSGFEKFKDYVDLTEDIIATLFREMKF